MGDDDAEIIELILNEFDELSSECTRTKRGNPKKDIDSAYCSVEDLLNIDTFIMQTENDNVCSHSDNICTYSDTSTTVLKVDTILNKEVIDFRADNNTNRQRDKFIIIIAECNKLTLVSNLILVPNKEKTITTPVENNSEDLCNEIINNSENLPNTTLCINSNEPLNLEVATVPNEQDLITELQNKTNDECAGSTNSDTNSPDIDQTVISKKSYKDPIANTGNNNIEEDQCNGFINDIADSLGVNSFTNFSESIFSEIDLALDGDDLILQAEFKIDNPPDGSINAGANASDNNNLFIDSKKSTCLEVEALLKEDDGDNQISIRGIDIAASSEIINTKNDIPSNGIANPTQSFRSQNELKRFTGYVNIYCAKCGESPWNARYKTNPNCLICGTNASLHCSRCKKEYTKYASIIDHLRYRCMPDDTLYQCSTCDYNTKVKSAFKKHVLAHKPAENIECIACGKAYKNERYLREHQKFYCPNRLIAQNVKCENCSKEFRNEKSLQLHTRLYCRKESHEQIFKCPSCDRQYKNLKNLRDHQRYYCQNRESQQNIKCPNCSKMFKNEMCVRRHQKDVCQNEEIVRNVMCPNCSKLYRNEILLRKHQRYYCKVAGQIRRVKCPDCGKELSNEMRLRKHYKLFHSTL